MTAVRQGLAAGYLLLSLLPVYIICGKFKTPRRPKDQDSSKRCEIDRLNPDMTSGAKLPPLVTLKNVSTFFPEVVSARLAHSEAEDGGARGVVILAFPVLPCRWALGLGTGRTGSMVDWGLVRSGLTKCTLKFGFGSFVCC